MLTEDFYNKYIMTFRIEGEEWMKKEVFNRVTAGMLGCILSVSAIQPGLLSEGIAQAAGIAEVSQTIETQVDDKREESLPESESAQEETSDQNRELSENGSLDSVSDQEKEAVSEMEDAEGTETEPEVPSKKVGDVSKAPALVITELTPDTSNVNGADAYEFIEIYNNSDRDIDLKDYKLYYNYPDNGPDSDTVWWESSESKVLKSGEILLFWIKNGGNDTLTLGDFNQAYGTQLSKDQVIEISCGGMSNSGARAIKLTTNVKDMVDRVEYNTAGADNTYSTGSIKYQNVWNEEAQTFSSKIVSDQDRPTPGTLDESSRPVQSATLTVPTIEPKLTDQTPVGFDNATEALNFSVTATADQTTVKTVTLYLKANQQGDFETYNLLRTEGDTFTKTLGNIDLLNKKSFTYYFEVSDGFHQVKTDEKTIHNGSTDLENTFNLKEGQVISRTTQIITGGDQMMIDGKDVTQQSVASPNGVGKFVFDASQTDTFFKNAVAIGNDVLGVFNEGTYNEWRTYIYDTNARYYNPVTKKLTVEIHAGNKANALEHNIENNDDFVVKNLRMVLPDGTTLYPSYYEGKKGLGAVEHDNMDQVLKNEVVVKSQESEISMGDGTSKVEILYATFDLPEQSFDGLRYELDTTTLSDGSHQISNGKDQITVIVDNTAPEINCNITEGALIHKGTVEISAPEVNGEAMVSVTLDDEAIEIPYAFTSKTLSAGTHILKIKATDPVGNASEKEIHFEIPGEDAIIPGLSPENGTKIKGDPKLTVKAEDPTQDEMTVTFKKGEGFNLSTEKISGTKGISSTAGICSNDFPEGSANGFPYEQFDIKVTGDHTEETTIDLKWTGESNQAKTFMYIRNVTTGNYEKLAADRKEEDGKLMLSASVILKDHLDGEVLHVMVQNGEGYTPVQYAAIEGAGVTTSNPADTPRDQYDFTFAVESDTQYYNEDYEGNSDQTNDGQYQYQLDIHQWVLENRERMNIQYLFHNGDIIDDEPNIREWEQADAAYRMLDEAGMPYGILAGNHDVGHLSGDYTHFGQYFGEARYASNLWYGGSYQNNRCHYDLISIGGIDFIMIYTGWGIGDAEIQWMNEVLATYPERKAILNFHEYLLASGGLGEEPQRVYDEVVSQNENVCLVFSGHYHNAYTRTDTFTNADGSTRKVTSMLFDYQGLPEGGMGYMRLLHFDLEGQQMIVRTYSPSLDDYDAKTSKNPGAGNDQVIVDDASINGEEAFTVSFEDLGIRAETKTLKTDDLTVNVRGGEETVIGKVEHVKSGCEAELIWKDAPDGDSGWYAEVTDENGGYTVSDVRYLTVEKETTDQGGSQGESGNQSGSQSDQNLGNSAQNGSLNATGKTNVLTGMTSEKGMALGAVLASVTAILLGAVQIFRNRLKKKDPRA